MGYGNLISTSNSRNNNQAAKEWWTQVLYNQRWFVKHFREVYLNYNKAVMTEYVQYREHAVVTAAVDEGPEELTHQVLLSPA